VTARRCTLSSLHIPRAILGPVQPLSVRIRTSRSVTRPDDNAETPPGTADRSDDDDNRANDADAEDELPTAPTTRPRRSTSGIPDSRESRDDHYGVPRSSRIDTIVIHYHLFGSTAPWTFTRP